MLRSAASPDDHMSNRVLLGLLMLSVSVCHHFETAFRSLAFTSSDIRM